jgi:hypothetical protein
MYIVGSPFLADHEKHNCFNATTVRQQTKLKQKLNILVFNWMCILEHVDKFVVGMGG